ncbi:hypothetical protein [Mumia sp. DW29H23]|uniref:hypothetical protein n=1 Tax=Mumia sp. DW29H23 TaxID=3421241 RepID=UPI003D685393
MSDLTILRDHARSMAVRGGKDAPLWTQIADEIDHYLTEPDTPGLFDDEGGAT